MWLSRQLSNACKSVRSATFGKVTSTQENTVTVQAAQEHREIKNVSPFGVVSIPPVGTKAVVIPTDEGFVYTGAVAQPADLAPGEVMLYSSGGASLILKNDGRVLVNGAAIN